MTAVPQLAPTLSTKANQENGVPQPSPARGPGWPVASTTSTRRLGRTESLGPKGKVLVRWLRRQEVPQLFLAWMSGTVTREDRSLKCGGRVGAEDGSNSKACRVT
jgi:hypothetical protein